MRQLTWPFIFIIYLFPGEGSFGQGLPNSILGVDWLVDSIYTPERSPGFDSIAEFLGDKQLVIRINPIAFKCFDSPDTMRYSMSTSIVNRCKFFFNSIGGKVVGCHTLCTDKLCAKDEYGQPCRKQVLENLLIPILGKTQTIMTEGEGLYLVSENGEKIYLK